jgi:hypothetical protein
MRVPDATIAAILARQLTFASVWAYKNATFVRVSNLADETDLQGGWYVLR